MMNIAKICLDIFAVVRSCMKACYINVVNGGGYLCHPITRVRSHVEIALDSKSKIHIAKGSLIESYCKISATDGGSLTLGSMVGVNRNSMIMCHESVIIGDNTIMGPGVCVYDHDHVFDSAEEVRCNEYVSSPVFIGKNCWIGAGAIILRGSTIGDNCLIAAGCIVKGNYPAGSVVIQKREDIIRKK